MTSDDARPASSQRPRPLTAELVVQEPAALAIAHRVAPDRIELCTGLALGGLTPSIGLLDAAVAVRAAGGPAVHVLIRPRTGTFVHDADEIDVMVRDVREAVARGADGVVVGAARRRDTDTGPGTALDLAAIGAMHEAAGGAEVTVHRVVDGEGRAVLDEDLARAFVAAVRASRRQPPDTNA